MEKRVFEFIGNNRMISDGDTVVAGVSGGADSVCLLLLLHKYAMNHSVRLIAAHVHHGLRENADGDEEYVKSICAERSIPLEILHIDAMKEAKEQRISVEEAGRRKRYEFFEQILAREGGGVISVAHNRDDLCETMLFQLFRGSGVSGLRGILPVSGSVVRPLLCVGRSEIEEYLTEQGVSWRTDESNEDLNYSRNRIRHEILPVAEGICSDAKEHMADAAERLRELEIFLDEETDRIEKEYLVLTGQENDGTVAAESVLIRNEVMKLPAALKGEILLRALNYVSGKKRDLGIAQTEALQTLFASQVGKKREFIYGITADRTYEGILLSLCGNGNTGEDGLEDPVIFPETEEGYPFTFRLGETEGSAQIPKDLPESFDTGSPYVKWFDYDIIKDGLCFRHPREGDLISVNKEGGHKALKDYLKDEKIPLAERKNVWVLACGSSVWWVVGHRIGEEAKITGQTKRSLCVTLK